MREIPDFNFVLGESGVTWLPYVFDRCDTEYHDRARSLGFKMKPSDYFRRQGFVTYQQDKYLEPIVPLVGEDNIIWGADYPHPDCIWPNSRATLEQNLAGFSSSVQKEDRPRQRRAALRAELNCRVGAWPTSFDRRPGMSWPSSVSGIQVPSRRKPGPIHPLFEKLISGPRPSPGWF